jgi:hypothetical protein
MVSERKTDDPIEHVFADYVYELSVNPSSATLFANPPGFMSQHNDRVRQRQIEYMIATHGPCPCIGVRSTPNSLGHMDWGLKLAHNIQLATPSAYTLFHQHVDALSQILKLTNI